MADPGIYIAILIGAAATWPAFFLIECMFRVNAFLMDWHADSETTHNLLSLVCHKLLGLILAFLVFVIFFGLPLTYFPAAHFKRPIDAYILSLVGVSLARFPTFYRRMRRLGITPEQHEQPLIPPDLLKAHDRSDEGTDN